MHEHKLPSLHELLVQLNEMYIDFLIDAHPEAFDSMDNVGFDENPHYESSLKPEFDLNYNEMAIRLGYRDLNGFVASELAELGVTQAKWIQEWQSDMLGGLWTIEC